MPVRRFRDFSWLTLDSWSQPRRVKIAMASACPYQNEFALAHLRLTAAAR